VIAAAPEPAAGFDSPDGRTCSEPAAATAGQAAYEVGDRVCVTGVVVATNSRADWVTIRSGCSLFAVDEASANPELAHAQAAIAAQQPQPAPELADLRERIGNLAAGIKRSADRTRPSKKTSIEDGCAAALLGLLDPR
jgi:hypothetical protein